MLFLNKIKDAVFLKKAMYTVLCLLVLLNIFILPSHPHFALEKIPGFWAIFGGVIAVILARTAKGAAHTILGRDIDFYEKYENTPTSSLKEAK